MEACHIAVRKLCTRRAVGPFAVRTLACSSSPYSHFSSSAPVFSSCDAADRGLFCRHISQLVSASKGSKKVMFVDTLALIDLSPADSVASCDHHPSLLQHTDMVSNPRLVDA